MAQSPPVGPGLTLPTIFHSSMVLQHSQPTAFWGFAWPGQRVSVALSGVAPIVATADPANGRFDVALPPQPPSLTPRTLAVTANTQKLTLTDVVFGSVYVCSGQSNMGLQVAATINATQEIAAAGSHGTGLRLMQVALEDSYWNVTTPQDNLTASIPWGRASPMNVAGFSALCFYFGAEQVQRYPIMPVGMIASAWGGTAIETWMTPQALSACGNPLASGTSGSMDVRNISLGALYTNPDPGLGIYKLPDATAPPPKHPTPGACPSLPSTLFNGMIAPLLTLHLDGFLWYQGESNAGAPEQYAKCFPEMIRDWRKRWAAPAGTSANEVPFIFAQIAPWPDHDVGIIAGIRFAQQTALKLPKVGMVVTADIGDPAGTFHPIHPPWKQEDARRAALVAENLVHNKTEVALHGPLVQSVSWDEWNPSWGGFHHGIKAGVCALDNGWICGGLQVKFDRPIVIRQSYGGQYGARHGFELWNNITGIAALGGTSAGSRQLASPLCTDCKKCPCWQPLEFSVIDSHTLQLNTTFISGTPASLRYAQHDYPTMVVFDSDGRPAPPFNVTIPYAAA